MQGGEKEARCVHTHSWKNKKNKNLSIDLAAASGESGSRNSTEGRSQPGTAIPIESRRRAGPSLVNGLEIETDDSEHRANFQRPTTRERLDRV